MKEKVRRSTDGNKGFSLVELIVVIAIMAVLVGILAPQFIKYVEKSRTAKCTTNRDTAVHAFMVQCTGDAAFLERALASGADLKDLTTECMGDELTCPSGGTLTYTLNPTTYQLTIGCSKHGGGSLEDMKTVKSIVSIINGAVTTDTTDSGATLEEGSSIAAVEKALAENGYSLRALGAASWQYKRGSNELYWSLVDISTLPVGTRIPVIKGNAGSGNYSVWITKVKLGSRGGNSAKYNVFDTFRAYSPSTLTDVGKQTYAQALIRYNEAMEAIKNNKI